MEPLLDPIAYETAHSVLDLLRTFGISNRSIKHHLLTGRLTAITNGLPKARIRYLLNPKIIYPEKPDSKGYIQS